MGTSMLGEVEGWYDTGGSQSVPVKEREKRCLDRWMDYGHQRPSISPPRAPNQSWALRFPPVPSPSQEGHRAQGETGSESGSIA